jgi:hypothetical protein
MGQDPVYEGTERLTEYLCNGYHCEKCGELVRVMKLDTSKPAEAPSEGMAMSTCPKCKATRLLTYEQILALPLRWTEQG